MEHKFRVYCEFELDGKLHKEMESEASWFLLSQIGGLFSHGPMQPLKECGKEYKKIIPLFYIGVNDKNDKEIFDHDIVRHKNGFIYCVEWSEINAWWCLCQPRILSSKNGFNSMTPLEGVYTGGIKGQDIHRCEIIGNVDMNPELLEKKNDGNKS